MTSQYELAILGAEMDAAMMPGATIDDDVDASQIVIRLGDVIVGVYPYKD